MYVCSSRVRAYRCGELFEDPSALTMYQETDMGRKSVRQFKNIFQKSRENAGFTRAAASDALGFVSEDRIEKIESGKTAVHPDEVLAMSKAYGDPHLCNLFCSRECPIGMKYVPEVTAKELPAITLQIVNSINLLEEKKNRLIEISVDGKISSEEIVDFNEIQNELSNISNAVATLQLWLEKNTQNPNQEA